MMSEIQQCAPPNSANLQPSRPWRGTKASAKRGRNGGVTASAVSHAVLNLEDRIGVRLLNRTTRSVSLTEAGELLVSHLDPAFGEMTAKARTASDGLRCDLCLDAHAVCRLPCVVTDWRGHDGDEVVTA